MPVIAGVNDNLENLTQTLDFLTKHNHNNLVQKVDLLTQHYFGAGKYKKLNKFYKLKSS